MVDKTRLRTTDENGLSIFAKAAIQTRLKV